MRMKTKEKIGLKMKVRHRTLTEQQIEALKHLKTVATRKKFYASFVANLYNNSMFQCDVAQCARYIDGEAAGDNRLLIAFNLMLSMAIDGIESHEYLGVEFVEHVIKEFDLKK